MSVREKIMTPQEALRVALDDESYHLRHTRDLIKALDRLSELAHQLTREIVCRYVNSDAGS